MYPGDPLFILYTDWPLERINSIGKWLVLLDRMLVNAEMNRGMSPRFIFIRRATFYMAAQRWLALSEWLLFKKRRNLEITIDNHMII